MQVTADAERLPVPRDDRIDVAALLADLWTEVQARAHAVAGLDDGGLANLPAAHGPEDGSESIECAQDFGSAQAAPEFAHLHSA